MKVRVRVLRAPLHRALVVLAKVWAACVPAHRAPHWVVLVKVRAACVSAHRALAVRPGKAPVGCALGNRTPCRKAPMLAA